MILATDPCTSFTSHLLIRALSPWEREDIFRKIFQVNQGSVAAANELPDTPLPHTVIVR